MEGILWVTGEGVGEDNGGDPILSVQRKGCLSPNSPAAEKLSHRVEHHLLFQDHLNGHKSLGSLSDGAL